MCNLSVYFLLLLIISFTYQCFGDVVEEDKSAEGGIISETVITKGEVSESHWLLPEPGSMEKNIGARVDSVTEEEGVQKIELSIPKGEKEIEEIVVIGKKGKGIERLEQKKRFKVINDPNTGRSGIVIYLGKRQQFVLRINYYEGDKNIINTHRDSDFPRASD